MRPLLQHPVREEKNQSSPIYMFIGRMEGLYENGMALLVWEFHAPQAQYVLDSRVWLIKFERCDE